MTKLSKDVVLKTITLKTEDSFFEKVTSLAKELHLSKSELIRQSIAEFEKNVKNKRLKEKMMRASLKVREANREIVNDFDGTVEDGLADV
ncbi:MAG: ribbon-helix-helix protein, CopG family [Campylobacterota bacterium]|nr:ribbon-helix-helix protein, CopG family [Campylobacterota bacterium]